MVLCQVRGTCVSTVAGALRSVPPGSLCLQAGVCWREGWGSIGSRPAGCQALRMCSEATTERVPGERRSRRTLQWHRGLLPIMCTPCWSRTRICPGVLVSMTREELTLTDSL